MGPMIQVERWCDVHAVQEEAEHVLQLPSQGTRVTVTAVGLVPGGLAVHYGLYDGFMPAPSKVWGGDVEQGLWGMLARTIQQHTPRAALTKCCSHQT